MYKTSNRNYLDLGGTYFNFNSENGSEDSSCHHLMIAELWLLLISFFINFRQTRRQHTATYQLLVRFQDLCVLLLEILQNSTKKLTSKSDLILSRLSFWSYNIIGLAYGARLNSFVILSNKWVEYVVARYKLCN